MLLVDDSPHQLRHARQNAGAGGLYLAHAGGGEAALALARREPPALIFLDIVMPGMNGFAVLRALRHDPQARHIPIEMISSNPQATE